MNRQKDQRRQFEELMQTLSWVMERLEMLINRHMNFGTGQKLTSAEIHTVETIGKNPSINVTDLAKIKQVTKGAISQMVTRLVKKDLVRKTSFSDNSKEVIIELTRNGWIAFKGHEETHRNIFQIVRKKYGRNFDSEVSKVMEGLDSIESILDEIQKQVTLRD
jgi:DNA-binding MarR family transcriptional regulator